MENAKHTFWGPDFEQLSTVDPEIAGVVPGSGLRVGAPSVTTQGMREPERRQVASRTARAVRTDPSTPGGVDSLAGVVELVAAFPAYPRG
ncbi:hypothetical protein ACIG87_12795 [Micromonospora sp. NPDC051925]|uniref:hypothetical protein n=1 Tax=Micromonospora sp. NPDC051925 TaxID=3364288 RepID=UPI0037C76A6A